MCSKFASDFGGWWEGYLCVTGTHLQQLHWSQRVRPAFWVLHSTLISYLYSFKSVSLKFAPYLSPDFSVRLCRICRWTHMESFNHCLPFQVFLCQPILVFCLCLDSVFWNCSFLPIISMSRHWEMGPLRLLCSAMVTPQPCAMFHNSCLWNSSL